MRRSLILPALAVGALGLAAGLPLSRPLVRQQAMMVLGGGVAALEVGPDQGEGLARTLVDSPAADADLAFGAALSRGGADAPALVRRALDRAPDDPALRAAALEFGLARLDPLEGPAPKASPGEVEALLADADAGERVAPDNLLFPLLRAAVLNATGQEKAAVREAVRASKKPHYDDYGDRRRVALWRFQDAVGSLPRTAMMRTRSAAGSDLAFLKALRAVARRLWSEPNGREALLALGERLQIDGGTLIVNLTGSALGKMARADQMPALADRAQALNRRSAALRTLVDRGNGTFLEDLVAISLRWFVALALLTSAVWVVLCGGLAHGLGRSGRIRRGERLDPAVGWGLALGGALPVAVGIASTGWGVAAVVGCLGIVGVAAYRLRGALLRSLGTMALTVLAVAGLFFVAGWITLGPGAHLASAGGAAALAQQGVLCGALCLAVPVLTALGLAIASWRRRVPASVGIVRGFRKLAVPTASVLLVLYAAAAIVAAQADRRLEGRLRASAVHEAREMAARLGQPWP